MIAAIATCGRRFFSCHGRISRIEQDQRGRLWLVDKYKGDRIYLHRHGATWRFTEGGTLWLLIGAFKRHIQTGQSNLSRYALPDETPEHCAWGYPAEDMTYLRLTAVRLGLMRSEGGEAA